LAPFLPLSLVEMQRWRMKLRYALKVISNWPPVWTVIGREKDVLRGEVGVLDDAYSNNAAESTIFLVVRVCAKRFIGALFLKDCSCRTRVLQLLLTNIGRPMREIGDLEF
jgi:hypothetical protein